MTRKIAVVGAGIAGLACARTLTEASAATALSVTLFDKSRGVGGRMATRRVDNYAFDHGAQYFTARGEDFSRSVRDAVTRGAAASWGKADQFVGTPGMTGLPRDLAAGLVLQTAHTVTRLEKHADGWTVLGDTGEPGPFQSGPFDEIVLAMPAPQIVALLKASNLNLPGAEKVRYAPCWALMLGFSAGQEPPFNPSLRFETGAIRWIANNSSKPGRASEPSCVVVHASPEWSKTHLEDQAEDVKKALMGEYAARASHYAEPFYASAHRWRFALVEEALGEPFLHDPEQGLGACGDWCLGPRVECAFDSGTAMARALLAVPLRHSVSEDVSA